MVRSMSLSKINTQVLKNNYLSILKLTTIRRICEGYERVKVYVAYWPYGYSNMVTNEQ